MSKGTCDGGGEARGLGTGGCAAGVPRPHLGSGAGWVAVVGLAGLIVGNVLTNRPAGTAAVVAAGMQPRAAQAAAADGGFTADQSAAGWAAYGRQCGECHGQGLFGAEAPALRGVDFLNGWAGQTTDELFTYLRDEMPPGLGGSLADGVYLGLVAYILDMNGARPGDAPLTADAAVTIGDAADIAEAERAAREGDRPRRRSTRFVNREVPHDLAPVTDALLADPPPGDWLSWRRTRDGHGYSPLDAGDARQRRRAAARVGARDPRGEPPDDAARARRGDVPRQPGERRPGD